MASARVKNARIEMWCHLRTQARNMHAESRNRTHVITCIATIRNTTLSHLRFYLCSY
jgi:hypothetical protein